MTYKVTIEGSFVHEAEVDAESKEQAKVQASDVLRDYLETMVRNSHKFDEFAEYVLKDRIISVIEVDPAFRSTESEPSRPAPIHFNKVAVVGCMLLAAFCLFVFVVGLCTLPTFFKLLGSIAPVAVQ